MLQSSKRSRTRRARAMIPGTVPCDVSAGHVTAGLSPVSWRRGISYGFAQFPVGTGVSTVRKQRGYKTRSEILKPRLRFDFQKSAIYCRFLKVRLRKHPPGMFSPLRMTRKGIRLYSLRLCCSPIQPLVFLQQCAHFLHLTLAYTVDL